MKIYLLVLLTLFHNLSIAQKSIDTIVKSLYVSEKDIYTQNFKNLEKQINEVKNLVSEEEKSWLERNGSWIAAIIIGLLTVFTNILINYYLRKSTYKTAKMQIENAKEIAIKQIKNSTIVAFRQKWIENLRDSISEFISVSQFVYLKIHLREEDSPDLIDAFKQLSFTHEKIKLYLNNSEETHKNITTNLYNIRKYLYDEGLTKEERGKVISETGQLAKNTKKVLKEEWSRIKNESL